MRYVSANLRVYGKTSKLFRLIRFRIKDFSVVFDIVCQSCPSGFC